MTDELTDRYTSVFREAVDDGDALCLFLLDEDGTARTAAGAFRTELLWVPEERHLAARARAWTRSASGELLVFVRADDGWVLGGAFEGATSLDDALDVLGSVEARVKRLQ